MVVDQVLQLLFIHNGDDFFRHLVHIAIAALQFKRRLTTVFIGTGGRRDIRLVDLEYQLLNLKQLLQHRNYFIDFRGAVAVA